MDGSPKEYRETTEAAIKAMEFDFDRMMDDEYHSATWAAMNMAELFNDKDSTYMTRVRDRLVRIRTLRELAEAGFLTRDNFEIATQGATAFYEIQAEAAACRQGVTQ